MLNHQSCIPGLPRRIGAALSALFQREGCKKHSHKLGIIHEIQAARYDLPLTADEDAIFSAADRAQRECYERCAKFKTSDAGLAAIGMICRAWGVPLPEGETDREKLARAVDRSWWIRQIRKAHARRCEHYAVRLGFTSVKAGPYVSNETAIRQARRNQQNARLLESITLQNEHGHVYTVAQLAALGTANKAIRRGELMTRIRGFEEIAKEVGHVGEFATITCPSKYHAVLSASGESNPKYVAFGEPTPRHAQAYLGVVWSRIRSKLQREGIDIYGFRIAEPHHDSCPHWHMLMFVAPEHAQRFRDVVSFYALAEDGDEAGAQKNRVKFVRVDPGKGSAAGYIAKYVAKNIDGEGVGEHKTQDGLIVVPDLLGDMEIVPSQRVCFWAQTWGIRQFQQIGGAPVGVWRELRRIKEEEIQGALPEIAQAWDAAQKKGDVQASWADYLRAQGGATVGRHGAIQLAKRDEEIAGKYATYTAAKPCGVYHIHDCDSVYESVRYTWTVKGKEAVAVAVPWTGVNNCTQRDNAPWITPGFMSKEFGAAMEKIKIFSRDLAREWKEGREGEWNGGN